MAEGERVVVSELRAADGGADVLEQAFRDRLREVEGRPGFRRLEVWRDARDPGRFVMVSWWADHASYAAYMRSDEHDRSHARVPADPYQPRAERVSLLDVVAE